MNPSNWQIIHEDRYLWGIYNSNKIHASTRTVSTYQDPVTWRPSLLLGSPRPQLASISRSARPAVARVHDLRFMTSKRKGGTSVGGMLKEEIEGIYCKTLRDWI